MRAVYLTRFAAPVLLVYIIKSLYGGTYQIAVHTQTITIRGTVAY